MREEAKRRKDDRERVRAALADVYRDGGIDIWMTSPHPSFAGLTAAQMIDAARTDEVLAEIERLTTGAFG